MRTKIYAGLTRRLLFAVLLAVAVAIALAGILSRGNNQSQKVPNTPAQDQYLAQVPAPQGTQQPTIIPVETPTRPIPPNTPTAVTLQPATFITPTTTSDVALSSSTNLSEKSAVNTSEALHSLAFAPTGDKLLYTTVSGNLYWSNLDGTNATLIHSYGPDRSFSILEDQMPKSDTLLILGYAIKFVIGQAPIITAAPDTLGLFQIRWWSTARASGIAGGAPRGGYVGNEQLVTLDVNGGLVSSVNVPYMESGAVQPGGTWLAYATSQQTTNTPFYGSTPQTIYLLNLLTGQRLQLTQPGMGWQVFSWSPDGNWIYASAIVASDLRGVLISADGLQWITVTPPGHSGYDAVWSLDSKHLAFSSQDGGCADPNTPCPPRTSQVYIVNVPERKRIPVDNGPGSSITDEGQMLRPKWSPDGSLLALLSFDTNCDLPPACSGTTPAFYLMNAPPNNQ